MSAYCAAACVKRRAVDFESYLALESNLTVGSG
jgi:hypothetical protein